MFSLNLAALTVRYRTDIHQQTPKKIPKLRIFNIKFPVKRFFLSKLVAIIVVLALLNLFISFLISVRSHKHLINFASLIALGVNRPSSRDRMDIEILIKFSN